MVLDAATLVVRTALNRARRRPDEQGGPAAIGRVTDWLAATEPRRADGQVWLPDTNARMSTAGS